MRLRSISGVLLTVALATGVALTATAAQAGSTPRSTTLTAPTNTAPVQADGTGTGTLVNVRTGRHKTFDRTVFDFTGGIPGYRVEYGTLVGQGTGDTIPLAGAADLVVVFNPAYAHNLETGRPTYRMTRTLNPRLPTLRQIRFGGDFEAYVSAGLGLADRVGFRVFTLRAPNRVVIDVAHQPAQRFGTSTVWLGEGSADTVVSGMRAGRHPGYDRLVFDLATPNLPLVFVAYRQNTSTITVGFSGQNVPAEFHGPRNVHFGLRQLKRASVSVYENGTATVFVTTARRNGFRVMVLQHPTRLVVDIRH